MPCALAGPWCVPCALAVPWCVPCVLCVPWCVPCALSVPWCVPCAPAVPWYVPCVMVCLGMCLVPLLGPGLCHVPWFVLCPVCARVVCLALQTLLQTAAACTCMFSSVKWDWLCIFLFWWKYSIKFLIHCSWVKVLAGGFVCVVNTLYNCMHVHKIYYKYSACIYQS